MRFKISYLCFGFLGGKVPDLWLVLWNTGSDEQRFLEASMAYVSGNPILNDEEYDKLKLKLKVPFPFMLQPI